MKLTPPLFAQGYRACDAIFLLFTVVCPTILYVSLFVTGNSVSWLEAILVVLTFVSVLGLLRVRIAFALLALPLFALATFKFVTGFFLPPEWTALRNPIYVVRAAFEVVLPLIAAGYFWRKFTQDKLRSDA